MDEFMIEINNYNFPFYFLSLRALLDSILNSHFVIKQ